MTFSDQSVVDFINANYTPVWESVAPVTESTFKLGGGREVKGTTSGEIAIYLCRPDGKVFDIVPGMQSPEETLVALRNGMKLFEHTDGAANMEKLRSHLGMRLVTLRREKQAEFAATEEGLRRRDVANRRRANPAGQALAAIRTKSVLAADVESFVVVAPGGEEYYSTKIYRRMVMTPSLRYPADWKRFVFEEVMEMPLKGGEATYEMASLQPLALME